MTTTILADRMSTMEESATLALNARAKHMAAEGKTIYNLTAGELASSTPDYIQSAVARVLDRNKYTAVPGLVELREAIAVNARDFYGLDWIATENVVVTAGAKPGLYEILLAIINPGDEVIVPTPAWVSYNHLIELVGGKVVEVPLTDDFDLDPEGIKNSITKQTKAILINSPHNPTGAVFSRAALQATAAVLNETEITVIADDIYAKLVYVDDFALVPTCGFEKVIILNGYSKSQALTGWRIGYVIAEAEVAAAITKLQSHVMGNAPLPSQYAALAALETGDLPPDTTLAILQKQRTMVVDVLGDVKKLSFHEPGGAFYVFLDVRELTDSSATWCEQLLIETGVALVPGEAFAAPGFARLSFVTDETILAAALEQIKQFAQKGSTS